MYNSVNISCSLRLLGDVFKTCLKGIFSFYKTNPRPPENVLKTSRKTNPIRREDEFKTS